MSLPALVVGENTTAMVSDLPFVIDGLYNIICQKTKVKKGSFKPLRSAQDQNRAAGFLNEQRTKSRIDRSAIIGLEQGRFLVEHPVFGVSRPGIGIFIIIGASGFCV